MSTACLTRIGSSLAWLVPAQCGAVARRNRRDGVVAA